MHTSGYLHERKQSKAIESRDVVYSIQKSQEFGHTAEKAQFLPTFNGKYYSCSVSANVYTGEGSMQTMALICGWSYLLITRFKWSNTCLCLQTNIETKNAISSIFILSYEIGWEWWQPTMSPQAKKRANRVPLCKFRRVIQPDGCWSRPRMRSSSFTISKTFTFVNFSKSSTTWRTVLKLLQQWK